MTGHPHTKAARTALGAAVLLLSLAAVTNCARPASMPHQPGQSGAGLPGAAAPSPATPLPAHNAGPVTASGHGWTSAGLDGTIPAPGSCHIRFTPEHQPLPDPACTPGAVDSAVSAGNLKDTVCRKGGYTASVRPPVELTEPAKKQIMSAYGIPWAEASKYELDHLVAEAEGGASDIRNLWPQPNTFIAGTASESAYIHNDKDQVETYVFAALCAGKVQLTALQNAMATNWTTAVQTTGLPAIPHGYK